MELNYKIYGEGMPILVLHGLLGSLDNWSSSAKAWSDEFMVITPDARNHGRSPRSAEFTYEAMCEDVLELLDSLHINRCYVLGHSMGGKTAMHFALQYPYRVEKLIVADIAPVVYPGHHAHIFEALLSIDLTTLASRQAAESVLRERLQQEDTVQFLMKALYRLEDNSFGWRFHLPAIMDGYENILGFQTNVSFGGDVLFLGGSLSNYIQEQHRTVISTYFPNYELAWIEGAGHWLHADKPDAFRQAVRRFLA